MALRPREREREGEKGATHFYAKRGITPYGTRHARNSKQANTFGKISGADVTGRNVNEYVLYVMTVAALLSARR